MIRSRDEHEAVSVGKATGIGRDQLIAPTLARAIIGIDTLATCIVVFAHVYAASTEPWSISLGVGSLLALLVLQVFYFGRPGVHLHTLQSRRLLAIQALLVFAPIVQYGEAWIGVPTFLAGTALLVLFPAAAWFVYVAVIAATSWIEWQLTQVPLDAGYIAIVDGVVALEIYGLTRLSGLIAELYEARAALAKASVAHERWKFARDLQDMLDMRLSEIAPKGELARRLVRRNAARAKRELSEILDISRRASADVRAVARSYWEVDLDEESRTAASALAAARVEVRIERHHGELPQQVRSLLAAVLRTGVINVLESSGAERCDIVMRQADDRVTLDIITDGLETRQVGAEPDGRSAMVTLSEQAARLGGRITTEGIPGESSYGLSLTVPVSGGQIGRIPTETPAGDHVPRTNPRLAQALLVTVLSGTSVISALRLAFLTDLHEKVLQYSICLAYLLLLLAIQLIHFSRPSVRLRSRRSYTILTVQLVLIALPALQFDVAWQPLPGFLAGSALLVFPPRIGWPTFAAVVLVAGWIQIDAHQPAAEVVLSGQAVVISGLAVYGLTWMVRSMVELRDNQIQFAQVVVAEERVRLARDLHDLLGLSLSAVTLKCELAHELAARDPDKARQQIAELLDLARLALTDVRSAESGSWKLSLDDEIRTAESLLNAADVAVQLTVSIGRLSERVSTLLATVLREGVTNVLRHSRGESCEITIQRHGHMVHLDIVNDGVINIPTSGHEGSGIRNLSYRAAMASGELTAGFEPGDRFRLRAKVPA